MIGLPNLATANNSLLSLYKPICVVYGVKYPLVAPLIEPYTGTNKEPVAKFLIVLSIEPVNVYPPFPSDTIY